MKHVRAIPMSWSASQRIVATEIPVDRGAPVSAVSTGPLAGKCVEGLLAALPIRRRAPSSLARTAQGLNRYTLVCTCASSLRVSPPRCRFAPWDSNVGLIVGQNAARWERLATAAARGQCGSGCGLQAAGRWGWLRADTGAPHRGQLLVPSTTGLTK